MPPSPCEHAEQEEEKDVKKEDGDLELVLTGLVDEAEDLKQVLQELVGSVEVEDRL